LPTTASADSPRAIGENNPSISILLGSGINVIKGHTGLYISFPSKKQRDGSYRDLAFPANAETRMMIQRAILTEYEKIIGNGELMSNCRSTAERLRELEQLKADGLINEEEYNTKRTEILGEL
jgi:DNA-binding cell septation regulator SpoVG